MENVGSTEINGEVTSGSTGSVLFIGDGAVLGQDVNNFNYSTSTGRLGIGTTTPAYKLSVEGIGHFGDYARASYFLATSTTATSTFSGGFSAGNNAALVVNQAATANSLYINPAGNIGIGTSTPYSRLSIWGDSASVGRAFEVVNSASTTLLSIPNLSTGTSTFATGLQATYLNLTSTTATSTFANGLNLTAGCLTYAGGACVGQNASVTLTQVVASSSVGSNTSFTVPTNTAYIIVETWGAGGGGTGGSWKSSAAVSAGSDGGSSCFGTNSTACTSPSVSSPGGGGAPTYSDSAAVGGLGGAASSAVGDVKISGGAGAGGGASFVSANDMQIIGGSGGNSPRGGGGGAESAGGSAASVGVGGSFGGGGQGGSGYSDTSTRGTPGAGGGAGAYSQK